MNDRNKNQNTTNERRMKIQCIPKILRRGFFLAVSCLAGTNFAGEAEQFHVLIQAPEGGGGETGGFGFVHRADGAGEQGHVVHFAAGFLLTNTGPAILKVCDTDGSGGITQAELKLAALASFKIWDADTNSTLTQDELSNGLKEFFPLPQLPVGFPAPPEEFSPNARLAKKIAASADTDTSGALTFQEVSAFLLGKSFSEWDQDQNTVLDAEECTAAFHQLVRPDGSEGVFHISGPAPVR
jgi:hypothetical protein